MTRDERRCRRQLVHAFAHYIHESGEYEWDVASHRKNHDLEPDQAMHTIRIDDVAAFVKGASNAARKRDADSRLPEPSIA